MLARLALLLAVLLAACGSDAIEVRAAESTTDYNHASLRTAVDGFAKAGRTPDAYGEMAHTVLELRGGMDRSVADEAELKLIVLALPPLQSVSNRPMAEQIEVLALTVWPTLLAPPIESDSILVKRESRAELLPKANEKPRDYLQRLCGGPLAGDCKQVVPEFQGQAIAALAVQRATERARNAVASCVMCSAEPGWHEAVRAWEALDRQANQSIHDFERKAAPSNWPTAGSSSELDPGLPEAEVTATGEIVIGGQLYGATTRIDALRELRFLQGADNAIALHLRPELTLAQVRALLADTKQSGAKKVAVIARAPKYPWERRIYWLADGTGTRTTLRPTDSLQLLLHTMDHIAGPGAIARVD